ncbi:MAG: hypothetical protein Q9177_004408 [Variospora cf. flavescens]
MSALQQPSATASATEPVTSTAQEASTDPVRTNATNDLTPESRPEVTEGTSTLPTDTTATDEITEAPKGTAAVESQPINEGVLAYKQPGLVKSLMYSKKFFWFGDEPVEHTHLSDYLRGEKATDISHPNAAHATQTGKGLLFFAKRAEDKPQPQGIINLADVKDIIKTGPHDFTFKYHSHKHAFQAASAAERDGWLIALENKQAEATTGRDGIVGSEGYKSSLEKFARPGAVGAASSTSRSLSRHKKTTDTQTAHKTTDKTTDKTTPVSAGVGGDSASSSDEAKGSNTKSRSQSRKRNSMFGALLGKKEQHDTKKELKKEEKEEKREEKAEEKAIKNEVKSEEKAEKQAEKEERKEEKLLTKEEKKAPKNDGVVDPAPLDAAGVGKKQFFRLSMQMADHTIASRVLADPVIPVEGAKAEEPLTATTDTTTPVAATETPANTTARDTTAPKANKRGSIFSGFFAKKEPSFTATPTTNTAATETAPVVPNKDAESVATSPIVPQQETAVSETAPKVDTAVPSSTTETAPITTSTTSPVSPVSPDTSKASRRSSFFSNLGTKKEKRTGGVSDAEGTDGEGKKSGGFGGLLRKASRAQGPKSTSKPAATTEGAPSTEAPAPISKDAPTTETLTHGEAVPESTMTSTQQNPVQATA